MGQRPRGKLLCHVEAGAHRWKRELIDERPYETKQRAGAEIFEFIEVEIVEFIEVWYNRQCLHSSLGYLSPVDYEATITVQNLPMAA